MRRRNAGSQTSVCLVEAGARVTIVDDLSNSFLEVLNRLEKLLGPLFSRITFKQVCISWAFPSHVYAFDIRRAQLLSNTTTASSALFTQQVSGRTSL